MTLSKELNKYQQQIVIIFLTLSMLILLFKGNETKWRQTDA